MIVCHCNVLSEKDLEAALEALLDEDPWQLVVPGKLFKSMQRKGQCCRCFPNVMDVIIRVTDRRRAELGMNAENDAGMLRLQEVKQRYLSRR